MKRAFADTAFYIIAMIVIMAVVQMITLFVCQTHDITPTIYTVAALISSVATIALFAWRKWTPCTGAYINTRPWGVVAWAALLSVGLMTPVAYVGELMGVAMPDDLERILMGVMGSDLGFVTVGIVAPVAEEMVLRGAVLRRLDEALGHRLRWLSITVSAILFAIIHGNMAQGIGAFLMGLALGWVYVRTRSVVPGIIMHWTNNIISVLIYRLMPGAACMTLNEYFGGDMKRVALMIVCSLMIAGASVYQLNMRLHRPQDSTAPQHIV